MCYLVPLEVTRMLGTLELELEVAVSHCVFAGNQPGSFARAVLITTGPPLQPVTICSPASLSTP